MNEVYAELIKRLKHANVITPDGSLNKQSKRILHQHKHISLLNDILFHTSFLDSRYDMRSRLFAVRNDITEQPSCANCGKDMAFNNATGQFNKYCSNKNGNNCIMATLDVQTKKELTTLERHGVTHIHLSDEINEKRRQTMMERFGGRAPIACEKVREKRNTTMMARYGTTNIAHIPGSNERRAQTNIDRYGATTYAGGQVDPETLALLENRNWLSDKLRDFTIQEIAEELGASTFIVRKYINVHDLHDVITSKSTSSQQREISRWLDHLNINHVMNDKKTIHPHELDILVPDMNLAIEFNGIFFHSELSGRSRMYHADKTQNCALQGIQLVHIWSNEWQDKRDIVESRIRNLLGVSERLYARKCIIRKLDTTEQRVFFNETHIQGYRASTVAYGLVHEGAIVAAMSFIPARYSKTFEWELLRFSSRLNTTVVGGASKLFKHFVRIHSPSSVGSYCDYRWGQGRLYTNMGFIRDETNKLSPNYFYFVRNGDTNKLMSRVQFQKHKLADRLDTFDPNKTEWENMVENGYDRIWDCGNAVFVWVAPES